MKKLFFFRSSAGNGTDKQEKAADSKMKTRANSHAEQEFDSPKSQGQVSGGPALRRSLSLSSAGFLFDQFGDASTNELSSATKSQDRRRNHSSRCFTPERQVRERQCEAEKLQHDSSGSSSSCSSTVSSKVLDRYIDGEEHLEQCKQKSCSSRSDVSGSVSRRRLPPRVQWTVPTSPSDTFNEKRKSQSSREAKGTRFRVSSADCVENGMRHGSPRSLARNVIERLSQTNGKSKGSNHEPITIQDVYGGSLHRTFDSSSDVTANVSLAEHYEPVNGYYAQDSGELQQIQLQQIRGKNVYKCMEDDMDSELEMKIKEAEKRAKLFSEELEQQRCLSDCDFDVSSLVGAIRKLEDERLNLAFENINLLRSQMVERASAREEIRWVKSDWNLHIQRLEKEKSELQAGLEKELDRRSGEWTTKLENFQLEEKKLRERVRELAEHNVSLQRELSAFHENEIENKDMITHLERRVAELTTTADELHEENSYVKQTLSQLQESYAGATEDLDFLRRNFEEKDQECRELHKSVTKFLRTCKEQGKTIEGLRDGVAEECKKQPSEKWDQLVKKLQVEQIRLTGIELSLRREVESMKLETDSLRHENICLLNRLKGNGQEIDITTLKLENELKMRVCYLQDQGLSMLNESSQLCYKLLKFIKGKLTQFPDTNSVKDGLSEQFMIESDLKVHGIRRGTENLKRSLQTVTSVVASNSESSCSSTGRPKEQRNQSVEDTLRAELKAETLITSLLREKLYSNEKEIEQLQAELAAAVRGNEILRCEVQSSLDNLSVTSHELKDLKHQMLKKEESINRVESNIQEAAKEMARMNALLSNVSGERDQVWRELRQCCEKNMLLNSENETLKGMVEKLEEKVLEKEGEMTILQDTIGSKHLNLLSSPDFLV
ncbi:PREDICTED: CAP-Gly domain-containing linker protein 1-like [Camelina sativa]|uniref:CAP-Gly domain-containing linker protein 1-like n=1 Tax=Camelina sativa TaxID=90675 RepID=A0ABM0YQB1_CAMSA|nr:PREDICTED: CAP-Gly domain-containing linker protein 1-like [Camelina sativa]